MDIINDNKIRTKIENPIRAQPPLLMKSRYVKRSITRKFHDWDLFSFYGKVCHNFHEQQRCLNLNVPIEISMECDSLYPSKLHEKSKKVTVY